MTIQLGTLGDCISWALSRAVINHRLRARHLTLVNIWKKGRCQPSTFRKRDDQPPPPGTENDDERKDVFIPLEEYDLLEPDVHYVAHYFVKNLELARFLGVRIFIPSFAFLLQNSFEFPNIINGQINEINICKQFMAM